MTVTTPLTGFEISYGKRPFTTNSERSAGGRGFGAHWSQVRKMTNEWRDYFAWEAKRMKLPQLVWCFVEVTPHLRDRRTQDVAACHPAAKAALDGLVRAGVLADDGPEIVRRITFNAPVLSDRDALVLFVEGETW